MVDTFQDGTTQGWGVGGGGGGSSPNPPTVQSGGGPLGASDSYLLLRSSGAGGSGSKLTAMNEAQWQGDYVTAGIGAIGMDLKNFGPSDLYLRLLFADPIAGPPTNIAFSTDAILLKAGGNWTPVIFQITPDRLTAGLGSVNAALTNATELRLFHNPDPAFPPPPVGPPSVTANLGVDNIAALAPVPEPSTFFIGAAGLSALALLRRRRLER